MALAFPSSPTTNQTFTDGTRTWRWTGTAWQVVSGYATAAQGTKADSALQPAALTPYRTSAEQDTLDANKVTNGGGASTIAVMTQAAYNALAVKDNNTIYILT